MIPNSTSTPEIPDDARSGLLTTLVGILSDVGGVSAEAITPTARLREDLAISSLNLIEAIVRVEDAFGVRIEDDDVQQFTTLGDIIDFLERSRPEKVS